MRGALGLSGVSATVTGPVTRTQQAMRVFSAKPSRSSVAFSSSEIGDVQAIPSLIATGSAPQMPIRQPASICMPLASAISSRLMPGFGATRLLSGQEGDLRARRPATVRMPLARVSAAGTFWIVEAARAAAAGAALARSRNGFSLRIVRTNQVAASAIAAARDGVVERLGAADHLAGDLDVEDAERDRAEQARDRVRARLHERVERREGGDADRPRRGPSRPRISRFEPFGTSKKDEHQAREGADEVAPVAAPVAVGVVEVGEVGGARVEVVAVLDAADARLAVRVGDQRERRLAVDALDREQRADRASTSRSCPSGTCRR